MRSGFTAAIGALGAGLLALAAGPAGAAEAEPFKMLTVDEVQQGVAAKTLTVFDANGPERYAKEHVPTARLIAYRTFTEADLPGDKGARLVFYCANTH